MSNVKANIKLSQKTLKGIEEKIKKASLMTMESLKADIIASCVMPFDSGTMQNKDTFTAISSVGEVTRSQLITGSPYAQYQYYGVSLNGNPLNYQTVNNSYARSHWLKPYADGNFLKEKFTEYFKSLNEGGG